MDTERRFARFIVDTPLEGIPASAKQTVQRMLLAVCGTGVAGAGEEGIEPLRRMLVERGGKPEATVLVFGDRLPAPAAAMLNGTMCRALDFCDAMAPGPHAGSSVVPAAWAAAELRGGVSGREFYAAIALGAETGARFNLSERMYDGFDPTGVAIPFAATAAAGRVLGLDEMQMVHALALAFNRCGGSFQSNVDGSLAVRLVQGFVAQIGVECALYAKQGLTGPVNFLEGHYGYPHLYGRDLRSPGSFVDALGERWMLEQFMFKKFPSCGVTQGVTQLALDLAARLGVTGETLEHAEVRLPPYAHRLVGHRFVMGQNARVNAQFSAQWCVANAIARRASRLEHFRPQAVADPAITALLDRISVVADAALDARGHSAVDLVVRTTDGRSAEAGFDVAPGYPGNALGAADHRARFDDCLHYAAHPLPAGYDARIVHAIESLDDLADARELLRWLVRPSR